MQKQMETHLKCPWCEKGELLVDGTAKVSVSVKCPRCGHVFTGNLDTMETEKGEAQKRQSHRK